MNKRIVIFILILLALLLAAFFGNRLLAGKEVAEKPQTTNVRIGWQTPWATQGQLTQVLKHTEILSENNLKGKFIGFTFGAPLNEAALAGGVDVIFTADQPAATLLSKSPNWVIIGRLMYNRVSLYVPPESPIKTVSDLKGKTVGMPFGAAAQRVAIFAEKEAGLDPTTDVNNINLGIYEQSDLVRDPKATTWQSVDALAGFDPTPAIFEEKGLVRNLKVGSVVSVIMMSKDFIKKHPGAPEKFLSSVNQAYDYYRQNVKASNKWFVEEAKLNAGEKALSIASSVEPNLKAKSIDDIRLSFTEEDVKDLQVAADFIYEQKLIQKSVVMKNHINMTYLQNVKLK